MILTTRRRCQMCPEPVYGNNRCCRTCKRRTPRRRRRAEAVHFALLPVHPTNAMPGTFEKIAVLAERAARRQELFHPGDA